MVVVSDLLKNGNFVQLLQPKIPWCWHVGVISLQNVPLECKEIKKQKERTSNKSSLPFPILTFHIQLPLCVSFGVRPNHMFWEVTNKMHRKKHCKGIHTIPSTFINVLPVSFVVFSFADPIQGKPPKNLLFLVPKHIFKTKVVKHVHKFAQDSVNRIDLWPPKIPKKMRLQTHQKVDFQKTKVTKT